MSENEPTTTNPPTFYITALRKQANSSELEVDYQVTKEFKEWYKSKHELKRWSRKHFEKTLVELIQKDVEKQLKSNRSPAPNYITEDDSND